MKLNKLLAAGLSITLAAAGVTIAQFEGDGSTGYVDPVGIATACYGHTETAVVGKQYSESECLDLLAKDLGKHNKQLLAVVNVPLSPGEHVAYLSFHYNVGAGNFRSSTLLRYLNSDQRLMACRELSRWVYADGRKLAGLVTRRKHERQLCINGVRNAKKPI